MSSFFPLPHRATLQHEVEGAADRSGQPTVSYVAEPIKKCLFLITSGMAAPRVNESFSGVMSFYVDGHVNIEEGDRVINILDKLGNVIEAGPFVVESVKKVPNLRGGIHHRSCKLRGIT